MPVPITLPLFRTSLINCTGDFRSRRGPHMVPGAGGGGLQAAALKRGGASGIRAIRALRLRDGLPLGSGLSGN
ncbi:hypothetical protein VUR80DRAFT_10071 [Thermomyces stellatus]